MAKVDDELLDMSEEQLAFEMIELTCDEMDSLTRALHMITDLCQELTEEIVSEGIDISDSTIH
jgi:hypothetical protein